MCGRFSQHWEIADWDQAWPSDWRVPDYQGRYNVAPGSKILVIVKGENGWVGGLATWGIPTPRAFLINARSETVGTRPTFRRLLGAGRCVIPMNGYYEWHEQTRQPFYIRNPDTPLWALGLYQRGDSGALAVVLTRPAAAPLGVIHPRMPVVADRNLAEEWLYPGTEHIANLLNLLREKEWSLVAHPVSNRVNKAANQGPDLIRPVDV